MKLKTFLIVILICLISILTSCSSGGGEIVDPTPPIKEGIEKIEAETQNEIGYLNVKYVPTNVVIYAIYYDGKKENVTQDATFEVNTSRLGNATVIVSYEGFKTSYIINVVQNTLVSFEYEIIGSKKIYAQYEVFDKSVIIVTGHHIDGTTSIIKDFSVEFYYENNKVESFNQIGTYEVRIIVYNNFDSFTKSYYISVVDPELLTKTYRTITIDTTLVRKNFENDNFEYSGLIVYGNTISDIEEIPSTDYSIELTYEGSIVTDFEANGDYLVIITYIGSIKCLDPLASYTVHYRKVNEENVTPVVTILSFNSAEIEIPTNGVVENIYINLVDDLGQKYNVEELNFILTGIERGRTFTLTGYYTTEVDGSIYRMSLTKTIFTTEIYDYFIEINKEELLINASANSLVMDVNQLVHSLPTDYSLNFFELLDDSNEVIERVVKSSDYILYFTGLKANTSYKLRVNFSRNGNSDYNYCVVFAGYETISDVYYQLRMRYNGQTLYTWYVREGSHETNDYYCNFELSTQLADEFMIIGCYTDLYNITKDLDVNIILAPKASGGDGIYNVAFYGWHNVLISHQSIQAGKAANAPTVPTNVVSDGLTYTFNGWNVEFEHIDDHLKVYAIYVLNTSLLNENIVVYYSKKYEVLR